MHKTSAASKPENQGESKRNYALIGASGLIGGYILKELLLQTRNGIDFSHTIEGIFDRQSPL